MFGVGYSKINALVLEYNRHISSTQKDNHDGFPTDKDSYWADTTDEMMLKWVDISSIFGEEENPFPPPHNLPNVLKGLI